MEQKFCDNCGKEIDENWFELTGKSKERCWGMGISGSKIMTCSLDCIIKRIDKHNRHITIYTKKGKEGEKDETTYTNSDIGVVDFDDCIEEDEIRYPEKIIIGKRLLVKPEVYNEREKEKSIKKNRR